MTVILSLLAFVLLTVAAIWRGYVLTILWAWFIVPVFHLPVLGVVAAIGISLVVTFLTFQFPEPNPEDNRSVGEKTAHSIVMSLVWPAIALLSGWVYHLFL